MANNHRLVPSASASAVAVARWPVCADSALDPGGSFVVLTCLYQHHDLTFESKTLPTKQKMEDNYNSPANRGCGHLSSMRSSNGNNNNNDNSNNNNKRYVKRRSLAAVSIVIILSFSSLSIKFASSLTSPVTVAVSDSDSNGGSRSMAYISSNNFDPSRYANIYEAIRSHPDLREFAKLCEEGLVKQILNLNQALTVFAPIDRSLQDLLAKRESRSIDLIELAKHHIAQEDLNPDENSKYPLQFNSDKLSPLYFNRQLQHQQQPAAAIKDRKGQQQHQPGLFVNNAKILATYSIRIDAENTQLLHLIDQVIEFAYLNRRAPSSSAKSKKNKFNLDDLLSSTNDKAISEFHDRFGDIQANQASVDLYHARAYQDASASKRLKIQTDELKLEQLGHIIRQHPELNRKLNTSEPPFNTYFLPVNNEHLTSLLEGATDKLPSLVEALVIPDQVLFTRLMPFGVAHSTLFDRLHPDGSQRISLSLAKTLPVDAQKEHLLSLNLNEESDESVVSQAGRRLLSTPLLVQAKCQTISTVAAAGEEICRPGVTSAEVLVANIPLSNGVLHLISRPLLVTGKTTILDYLNDTDNQLTNLVASRGSRTASSSSQQQQQQDSSRDLTGVNRFKELLTREGQMLPSIFSGTEANFTLLVPSDKAFARLRYDLRALVNGDESLIPKHWSQSYRQASLKRLLKNHLVPHKSITTDQLQQQPLKVDNDNGPSLTMSAGGESSSSSELSGQYFVDYDSARARLIQHDLIGSNGVMHIIDRVLGEEQETVYSSLKWVLLKNNNSLEDLNQRIQSSIQQQQQQQISTTNELPAAHLDASNDQQHLDNHQQQLPSAENQAISKTIGQYLDELVGSQLQQLASSVSISYQLAESLGDWNEKFDQTKQMFTYFVPSDLAWIRLQQAQPKLYKPLMHFLELHHHPKSDEASATGAAAGSEQQLSKNSIAARPATDSESSRCLRKILERHLVLDKIDALNLNQLDSLRTRAGDTLRLVESPLQPQLTADDGSNLSIQPAQPEAYHSISSTGMPMIGQLLANQPKLKSLKLDKASANIVQANEASNGFVYIVDNVLLLPDDSNHLVLTGQAAASSMSSLWGADNSPIFDFVRSFLAPAPFNMSTNSILALLATLTVAIVVLLIFALVLVVRKSRQSKQNRHHQLESGLTSSSSANSGSTSTTKSL